MREPDIQIEKDHSNKKEENTGNQPVVLDEQNNTQVKDTSEDNAQAPEIKAPGRQEGALLSSEKKGPPRIEKIRSLTKKQRRRQLRVAFLLLILMTAATALVVYKDYRERPGIVETDSLRASKRTPDSITLEWDQVRNTDTYSLYYKKQGHRYKDWERLDLDADSLKSKTVEPEDSEREGEKDTHVHVTKKVGDLEEGVKYVFRVRADNDERKGFITEGKAFSTMKTQKVETRDNITKLTSSKPFIIDVKAKTALEFKSSDDNVAKVDGKTGKVTLTGPGKAAITVAAKETDEYMGAESTVNIHVIASDPVTASGASAFAIYTLDESNCEVIKAVVGEGGNKHCPQAFGYSGDKYYIAYGSAGAQRIVTYDVDGDGRSVSVPDIALGHPNGFCYADSTGLCYCVRGWSGRCVTYSPETGRYGVITLPRGASGIGYDRDKNRFYTSSRTGMVSYSGDGSFKILNTVGVVKHRGYTYTQDCGGHAGIMMRCLSGKDKHGTNYIDLYDMEGGKYLGSLVCRLSEVESAVCDEDGYLLILANNTADTDYIWKTGINIKDIAEGL